MASTEQVLARLRNFARALNSELPMVDVALHALRSLLHEAKVRFKLVGGVAVVHHGYARTTEDVDVLVDPASLAGLDGALASHGFERVSGSRLKHAATGVVVDLLIGGAPLPRAGAGVYPAPDALAASNRDPDVVGLAGLLELKLMSRRHRDEADVVELLKPLDEARYTEIEAALPHELRAHLSALRKDALEELGER